MVSVNGILYVILITSCRSCISHLPSQLELHKSEEEELTDTDIHFHGSDATDNIILGCITVRTAHTVRGTSL